MDLIILSIMFLLVGNVISEEIETKVPSNVTKVLSRKKRFLIFPDGSSLQLVFCTQNHGYLQIGDIVWFGNTAALAWELPSDPDTFRFLKYKDKEFQGPARRRNGIVYYVDEDGRVIDKKEYRKKMIVNPAFAKRSIDATESQTAITKDFIKEMHQQSKNKALFEHLGATRIQFHREGRKKLYPKLETLLETLGWSGSDCVQKLLCEAGQNKNDEQGTFLGEITRAVFTLPKVQDPDSDIKHYDEAHGSNGECGKLYPECGEINVL